MKCPLQPVLKVVPSLFRVLLLQMCHAFISPSDPHLSLQACRDILEFPVMKMPIPRAYRGLGSGPTRAELLSPGGGCCYLNARNLLVAYPQLDFLNIVLKYYLLHNDEAMSLELSMCITSKTSCMCLQEGVGGARRITRSYWILD